MPWPRATPPSDRSIDELDVACASAGSDVRELLVHFRTRTSEEDIEAALRATLSKFEHQTGMATSLSMAGHGLPCRPMCRSRCCTCAGKPCRIVRKHAKATRVELRVECHPRWRFEVRTMAWALR